MHNHVLYSVFTLECTTYTCIVHTYHTPTHLHITCVVKMHAQSCITSKCNLEREYRDCIKSRRDKIRITSHIMMHQVLYIVQKRVTCTLYSTWCIMICLVILILSLLLFIQSLYSFLNCHLLVSCPFLLLLVITLDIRRTPTIIGTSKHQK